MSLRIAWLASSAMLTASCTVDRDYVVVRAEHGSQLLKTCSRDAPKADSFFRPSSDSIRELEAQLDAVASLKPSLCCNSVQIKEPHSYYRQYVGYVAGESRAIYVNAYPRTTALSRKPVIGCDGGARFWGVSYDAQNGRFFDLAVNGDI